MGRFEFSFTQPDEMLIGLSTAYGGDEYGEFHVISFGLFFFSIEYYNYNINNDPE